MCWGKFISFLSDEPRASQIRHNYSIVQCTAGKIPKCPDIGHQCIEGVNIGIQGPLES